jgi:two-component system chemotaxis sensor kinase CheA
MAGVEDISALFFQECDELLADLEQGLLQLERGEGDGETVNAIFRAVHSIKGGAGAFGLEPLVRFAHVFETALDAMRSNRLAASADVLKVMLQAADILSDHVSASRESDGVDSVRAGKVATALSAFTGAKPHAEPVMAAGEDFGFEPVRVTVAELVEPPARQHYQLTIRPAAGFYGNGREIVPLLREVAALGEAEMTLDVTMLPTLHAMDPEQSYLRWTIRLVTTAAPSEIHAIFEFVDDLCAVTVEQEAAVDGVPEPDVLPMLARAQQEPAAAAPPLEAAGWTQDAGQPLSGMAGTSEHGTEHAEVAGTARAQHGRVAEPATIRVDLERVDRLINLVGELAIGQAMLAQRVGEAGLARSSDLCVGLDSLEQLTRQIQDCVTAIRAQPVKSVFQRMPRLVREVSAMTGKPAQLVMVGESTEVDRTVLERLTSAITHMIRNAVDHGLESAERRLAAGKPAVGTVRLSARHRSGRVIIEIADDGGGINRAKVRQIAADKGLIAPTAALTDEEVDSLIFMPGFSTANMVSDISGRGVGLDVVRRSIQELGGQVSIASQPGTGSIFTMSLPLTLAVLDGMVVSIGRQTLVVPLTAIIEFLQPRASSLHRLGPCNTVVAVRGAFVPVIDVGVALGCRNTPLPATTGVALLIESQEHGRAALMVDAIQGQRRVVIKSLEANYGRLPCIAAATILGDGRVALILDIDAMIGSLPGGTQQQNRLADLTSQAAPILEAVN